MIVPSAGGECRDLTPGDIDSPPLTIDSGGFAFSPDSREICFCRNNAADTAVSTNNDLFTVDLATGAIMQITDNPGSDTSPAYSPDGRFIAYLTQLRPGYESDRAELMIYDRSGKTKKYLTDTLDRSIDDFVFAPDGKIIFFSCEDSGYRPLYSVAPLNPRPKKILDNITAGSIAAAGGDVFFVSESFNEPIDIYASASGRKTPRRLTSVNASFLLPFELKQAESVTYTGAAGTAIQGWVVKPSSFRPDKKYPLLVIIHGGPHDAHLNAFSYRWNAQVLANAGPFVIFLPNPRGSTGFGQAFCDGINKDWGGKVYIDIMTGVEYMAKQPFIDGEKVAAAGGSFGGYMVNWMAGRTDRFKALVCHAGLFNLPAFYGTTEELWFPEWEFGGCPWDTPESYEAWSPLANANNIKTPMLLIHGEQDYRVSISEAQQLFSILQRRHIPSKFLWFPDEGHSIQKPKNVMLWYSTVLSWLRQYLIES